MADEFGGWSLAPWPIKSSRPQVRRRWCLAPVLSGSVRRPFGTLDSRTKGLARLFARTRKMTHQSVATTTGSIFLAACAAFVVMTGCAHDPRININEFVRIQQSEEQEATTQPTTDLAAVWTQHGFIPYRIGPGDELSVILIGLRDSTEQTIIPARVNRDGQMSLPMVGDVKVGDLEIEDVERAIHNAYVPAQVRSLSVHIQLVAFDTTNVLVVGAVSAPGITALRRTERDLLHAVANAHGFSPDASGRVTLQRVRQTAQVMTLDLLDPNDLSTIWTLPPLESGDILTVESAPPNTVFVGGLVNLPGPKNFPPGSEVNLLQALAASGGVREDVSPSEGTLIRRMSDGRDVQVKLDLNRLRRGEDPNIVLAAGDIFWVPETVGTKVMDFVNRNIYLRAGVSVNYDPIYYEQNRMYQNRQKPLYKQEKRNALIHPFGGSSAITNPLTISNPVAPPAPTPAPPATTH